MFRENIRQALGSVRSNFLRASLTIFIIAFGIMAIVGVLTTIDGIKFYLKNSLSSLGSNTFKIQNRESTVRLGGPSARRRPFPVITLTQAEKLQAQLQDKALVSIVGAGPMASEARYRNLTTNRNLQVKGVDENFVITEGYQLAEGRFITAEDVTDLKNVAVIGNELKVKLFPNSNPINSLIFVEKNAYRVIGLFKEKGSSLGGSGDKVVAVPLTTLLKDFPDANRSFTLNVYVDDPTLMPPLAAESEGLFRRVRALKPAQPNNFAVSMADSVVATLMEQLSLLTISATAISLITLFGAAIGLMNIMLVSVTERTREIGVRKALGASRRAILTQFLTEAVTICQMGGVVGILFGLLIGNFVSLLLGSGFIIPWLWILVAFIVCFLVGVSAGYYPARRAASLDPIDSLRYE